MSAVIYSILDDLRHLPSAEVSAVARYIHGLRENRHASRAKVIDETSGSLSGPDFESFEAAIRDCEQIDAGHASW